MARRKLATLPGMSRVTGSSRAGVSAEMAVHQAEVQSRCPDLVGHELSRHSVHRNRSVLLSYSNSWPPNPSSGSVASVAAPATAWSPEVLRRTRVYLSPWRTASRARFAAVDCFFDTVGLQPGGTPTLPAGEDRPDESLLRGPGEPWPTVPRTAWAPGAAADGGTRLAMVWFHGRAQQRQPGQRQASPGARRLVSSEIASGDGLK